VAAVSAAVSAAEVVEVSAEAHFTLAAAAVAEVSEAAVGVAEACILVEAEADSTAAVVAEWAVVDSAAADTVKIALRQTYLPQGDGLLNEPAFYCPPSKSTVENF
jgi:3-methyladenine DNA glycosylase AlkD